MAAIEETPVMIAPFILASILSSPPQDATPLTFLHGDEQVVTWLDRASVRRIGDRFRARALRVRHPNQAFWVVHEIDCVAGSWALVATKTATETDSSPPSLEGEARHYPIQRYSRFTHALKAAGCDGVFVEAHIETVRGAAAAVAVLTQTKDAAVRARPLELIVVRAGPSPVFIDRATLEGGGPQWEVRSLKMKDGRGVWSGWQIDCERSDLAVNLYWTGPLVDGGYGLVTRDIEFGGVAAANPDQRAIVDGTCHPEIWDHPAHDSIDEAMRAAGG